MRNRQYNIRISDKELSEIKTKAKNANISVSDLLLLSVDKPIIEKVVVTTLQRDKNFIYEINKIGNNLNQLAHYANTYKSKSEALLILDRLEEIKYLLSKLNDK